LQAASRVRIARVAKVFFMGISIARFAQVVGDGVAARSQQFFGFLRAFPRIALADQSIEQAA
jgi:hypothetical protein